VYPDLATLRKLEKDTLRRITEIGEFGKLSQLRAAANASEASINVYAGPINVHLGFTLDIRLRGDHGRRPVSRRIDLGVLVQGTPDKKSVRNASYSLLICRYAVPATSPIVRKMHFDYEAAAYRDDSEPKPSAHMQICGKFSSDHLNAGYTEKRLQGLYPSWEKPRVPLPPTSLALMLNWLLLEFQSDPASQGILNSPTWRNWVAHAERTMLVPYFKAAATFLERRVDSKKRFLQTHLYEMAVD
jgi:hypothetical protein